MAPTCPTFEDSQCAAAINVLVVDDHQMAREWTATHLSQCTDFRIVATARNGAEAYRMLAEMALNCVVLDIQLPDCSGVDIARHVRRMQPEIAVVVLTSHDDPAYRSALARLGVQQFLTKEASAQEIEAAVREAVRDIRRLCPTGAQASESGQRSTSSGPTSPARLRNRLRVLVVEDHPLTGEGTSAALAQAGLEVVGVAGSGQAALELAGRHLPDVVVLDLQLPDMSGVTVAQKLLHQWPGTHIVVLTAHGDAAYGKALSRMGVDGYLSKEATPRDLVAAIQSVAHGGAARGLPPRDTRRAPPALSERERRILSLVSQGCTNAEIAETLSLSSKAVEYHLTAMFQHFEVRNRTELTRQALAHGLT